MSALPEEYLGFLGEVGWGEIGESQFMLYEAPINGGEVHPNLGMRLWLLGDDFSGYSVGFDREAMPRLSEADPFGKVLPLSSTFLAYIEDKLASVPQVVAL